MNNFIGYPSQADNNSAAGQPSQKGYRTYQKVSSIPSATMAFVTLDEREDSINDAVFFTAVDQPGGSIGDIPANHHSGGSCFSFADGHSEIHHWLSSKLKGPIQTTASVNAPSVTIVFPEPYFRDSQFNDFPAMLDAW